MTKIAYIRWLDARGCGGSRALTATKRMKGLEMETAGILVNEDKDAIRIAQDIYIYADDEEATVRDIEIIPTKYVISRRVFEIKNEKHQ